MGGAAGKSNGPFFIVTPHPEVPLLKDNTSATDWPGRMACRINSRNVPSCLGIDKECACSTDMDTRAAFHTVRFVKMKSQIVGHGKAHL
jgi:hypothetical protein